MCLWVICCNLIFPIALYQRGHLLCDPWGGGGGREKLCNSHLPLGFSGGAVPARCFRP